MARTFTLRQELWTTNRWEINSQVVRRCEYLRPHTKSKKKIVVQLDSGKVVWLPTASVFATKKGAIKNVVGQCTEMIEVACHDLAHPNYYERNHLEQRTTELALHQKILAKVTA